MSLLGQGAATAVRPDPCHEERHRTSVRPAALCTPRVNRTVNRRPDAPGAPACHDPGMARRSSPPLSACLGLALLPWLGACQPASPVAEAAVDTPAEVPAARDTVLDALRSHARDVGVEGRGTVVRVLPDDRDGSPHQRFLLRLADGSTVLVAHNIDLAPRLEGLGEGEAVEFRGEYVWNPKGGTLHWTHHDPRGTHPDGWLRWRGRTYR
jgi:hypothetical protein